MIAIVSRLLQLIGMVILPIGLYVGMFMGDVRGEVQLLTIGGIVFVAGWLLQKKVEQR